MQGDKQVIKLLNHVLKNELTAINQYFLHARQYEHWGLERLGHKEYDESIDEMKHADRLVKRILLLGGLPNLQDLGRLRIGENVQEVLTADLELEREAIPVVREAIAAIEKKNDFVTRALLVEILEDEEEHEDWLETQLELIEKVGVQNYTQSQMGEGES